ncbi:hypothetical protein CU098_004642 [Rhizopus stolonifer]|uniref:Uncharacterized protein n=1 Tax=Rhizopus stolonifer TaxID=4846 RepID=A0A367KV62_RHIST|nr:hypothetical protein CU098_004642 [Rhizopus stolonifer]
MKNKDLKTDYKQVLASWDYELSCKPLDTDYYSQSEIMHIFCSFLNQVWTDAKQNIEQSWGLQDEVIINMLQLMKRSLETRQKLSAMIYRLKDSGATICRSPSSISSFASDTLRPIKLTSSPSTPTVSISNESDIDQDTSASKLLLADKSTMSYYYKEKLFRYHLLQRTIKDSLTMDQDSTTTKSLGSSISSLGYTEKETSEESSEHASYLSCSPSSMCTEAHVVVSTTTESSKKSDKRKENKFTYLLKGSSSQLSLFSMKKKQTKEGKIKTSFIKRILKKSQL